MKVFAVAGRQVRFGQWAQGWCFLLQSNIQYNKTLTRSIALN